MQYIPKKMLDHQIYLEKTFSENELIPRMKGVFKEVGIGILLEESDIDVNFGLSVLVQLALHKRMSPEVLIGMFAKWLNNAQQVADTIITMTDKGFVKWDHTNEMYITVFSMPDSIQQELDMFQFPLPLVIPPKEVNSNVDTGYHASGAKGSLLLRDNHHMEDICLDHINRANKVAMSINGQVAMMVKNKWKNLDKPKEGESTENYKKRVKAFEKYDRHAYRVMAFVFKENNKFYLTHRYDKRGRVYPQGYYINPQGNEWHKAIIEFTNKEVVC